MTLLEFICIFQMHKFNLAEGPYLVFNFAGKGVQFQTETLFNLSGQTVQFDPAYSP
ncbi:amidohydrolase family protein [Desulfitobacterium sp. AusDCA]